MTTPKRWIYEGKHYHYSERYVSYAGVILEPLPDDALIVPGEMVDSLRKACEDDACDEVLHAARKILSLSPPPRPKHVELLRGWLARQETYLPHGDGKTIQDAVRAAIAALERQERGE